MIEKILIRQIVTILSESLVFIVQLIIVVTAIIIGSSGAIISRLNGFE